MIWLYIRVHYHFKGNFTVYKIISNTLWAIRKLQEVYTFKYVYPLYYKIVFVTSRKHISMIEVSTISLRQHTNSQAGEHATISDQSGRKKENFLCEHNT